MVAIMDPWRRTSGIHKNCARRRVLGIKWVSPPDWETAWPYIVDWSVEIFPAVTCSFDHDNPFVNCIADCGELIWPPFNCNKAFLTLKRIWSVGTCSMDLEQYNVPSLKPISSSFDSSRHGLSNEGRSAKDSSRRYTDDSYVIGISTNNFSHSSAVINKASVGAVGGSPSNLHE
jgi:hypothetical protein